MQGDGEGGMYGRREAWREGGMEGEREREGRTDGGNDRRTGGRRQCILNKNVHMLFFI